MIKVGQIRLTKAVALLFALLVTCIISPAVLRANAESASLGELEGQIRELLIQGNLNQARSQLDRAIRKYPVVAGFYDLLGVVDAQDRHFVAAEKDFKRSIGINSKLLGAYLNLAHLYLDQSATKPALRAKAIATYKDLLAVSPNNIEGNFQLALLLEQNGEFSPSVRYLARLPASARIQSRALALLAADYAGRGMKDKARSTAAKLLATNDFSEADAIPLVRVLEAHHDKNLEILVLRELEEKGNASLPLLKELGALYAHEGQLAKARSTLEDVATRSSKPVSTLMELAQIAERQKDYKGALGYLARARDIDPHNSAVHFLFGMICVQENLGDEAYESLTEAVQLSPSNPYYNYALGAVILDREDPAGAIPYFKKYSQLRPGDPRGRLGVGLAYFYSHNLNAAANVLRSVVDYPKTGATAHCFLGHIALLEGNLDQAIEYSELAIKERPGYADAFVVLGQALMNQNRTAAAEKEFRKAIDKRPNDYLANLELMILYERNHDPHARRQEQKVAVLKKRRDLMARRMLARIKIIR